MNTASTAEPKKAKKLTPRQAKWQGGKWITPVRRVGIYARDGFACVYCGATVEDGATILSLDHLVCDIHGGTNASTNLVTCCKTCNSSRGARPVAEFCDAVAAYLNRGIDPRAIEARVYACAAREVPIEEARTIIARRRAEKGATK